MLKGRVISKVSMVAPVCRAPTTITPNHTLIPLSGAATRVIVTVIAIAIVIVAGALHTGTTIDTLLITG